MRMTTSPSSSSSSSTMGGNVNNNNQNLDFALVRSINEQLISKHIHVSLEWIKQCIEFLRMNGPYSPDSTVLAGYVFNCFLTYDIAVCRAEQKVVHEEQIQTMHLMKVFQNKPVVLQVDEIINISSSKSNQLKKAISTANTANTNTSNPIALPDTDITDIEDEAEIGKMNKVLLTDGYEHYVGLDLSGYFLSKQSPRHRVTAGVKIMVQNALVRRGAILLDSMCVTYLGGGVPDLLKSSLSTNPIGLTTNVTTNTTVAVGRQQSTVTQGLQPPLPLPPSTTVVQPQGVLSSSSMGYSTSMTGNMRAPSTSTTITPSIQPTIPLSMTSNVTSNHTNRVTLTEAPRDDEPMNVYDNDDMIDDYYDSIKVSKPVPMKETVIDLVDSSMDEYLDQEEAYLETLSHSRHNAPIGPVSTAAPVAPTAAPTTATAAPTTAPTAGKMDTTVSRTTTVGTSLFDTLQISPIAKERVSLPITDREIERQREREQRERDRMDTSTLSLSLSAKSASFEASPPLPKPTAATTVPTTATTAIAAIATAVATNTLTIPKQRLSNLPTILSTYTDEDRDRRYLIRGYASKLMRFKMSKFSLTLCSTLPTHSTYTPEIASHRIFLGLSSTTTILPNRDNSDVIENIKTKKYFYEIVIDLDDGFGVVTPAIVTDTVAMTFFGRTADQLRQYVSSATTTTGNTSSGSAGNVLQDCQLQMLNFQGIFVIRVLTPEECVIAKNNAKIVLECILNSEEIGDVCSIMMK